MVRSDKVNKYMLCNTINLTITASTQEGDALSSFNNKGLSPEFATLNIYVCFMFLQFTATF